MQNEFDYLSIGGIPVYAADVEAREDIAELRELYQSLTQSDIIPCTSLPSTGVANKIYRLAGEDSYADYMYAPGALTTPIKMAQYDNAIEQEFDPTSEGIVSAKGTAEYMDDNYLRKGTYDASTAVGLADNIRGDVYADEQFSLRMTGGEANDVGGIGVVQIGRAHV